MNDLLLLLCLAGAWFFSGIETGLISINRLRLQHLVRRKVRGARTLQFFLQNPDTLLGTTLVGTNICVTVASTIAVAMGADAFGAEGAFAASAVMTLVLLVFCEYFPKAFFQSAPAARSLPFAPILRASRYALMPIGAPLMFLIRLLIPLRRAQEESAQPLITRDEIVHLAGEGKTSGILTQAEHKMIHEVIQLTAKTCREIMTPRDRMTFVQADTTVPEMLNVAREKVVNRFPVYDPAEKRFIGIVHIFDILADDNSAGKKARDYMRPPQFVADYTPVDHVLPRMRVTRQPLVIVTDDRFEVIGIVTLEDVLGEILGVL